MSSLQEIWKFHYFMLQIVLSWILIIQSKRVRSAFLNSVCFFLWKFEQIGFRLKDKGAVQCYPIIFVWSPNSENQFQYSFKEILKKSCSTGGLHIRTSRWNTWTWIEVNVVKMCNFDWKNNYFLIIPFI